MTEQGPEEGRHSRLRRIRQKGEEPRQRQGVEDALQKAQRMGQKIAARLEGGSGGSRDDVPGRIRRLAELRDEGYISNEEFETKKRELLKSM